MNCLNCIQYSEKKLNMWKLKHNVFQHENSIDTFNISLLFSEMAQNKIVIKHDLHFDICSSTVLDNKEVWFGLWFMGFNATFNNISVVVVSFICGGNQSTRRKQQICRKSLSNFIT